jgi:ABC-type polysaccharide/polyol phosphate export permease
MLAYLRSVWRCRFFWLSLVKMDLRTRYRRSILGIGWSLLHPIAMTIIFCMVFQHLMMPEGGASKYAPMLLAGLATWNYILTATLAGCQCFFLNESYIRQYPAPMAIYPLRTALGGLIHFLIALAVVLCLVWFFNGFENLPVLWFLFPAILVLFLFSWSLAVLAGVANVYFQDTQHLCEVGFQIIFYMTPILYPAEMLRNRGLGWLTDYNPIANILDLLRVPLLQAKLPSAHILTIALGSVALVAGSAAFLLSRCQRRLIFQL